MKTARPDPAQTLQRAHEVIRWVDDPVPPPMAQPPEGKLHVGVDLGTAYLVVVVLDEDCQPIAGEYQFAQVVRDGLVVDFVGAIDLVKSMKQRVEERLGRALTHASSGYPPGVPRVEVQATANVVEAGGFICTGLVDEPTAANALLGIQNGAIVDVGGGTTGISIFQDGQSVYTADEATGGTHFSLVIAGAHDIPFEEAERMKINPEEQARLFPIIRPVMEKVGSIVSRHIASYESQQDAKVEEITLVGGTSAYPGIAGVVEEYTGVKTTVPEKPLFVTPVGIAMHNDVKEF